MSIGDYFLGEDRATLDAAQLDFQISCVIKEGGTSFWDSPSSELYGVLCSGEDVLNVIKRFDRMRDRLNQSYMNTRHAYKSIQQEIILKT